MPAENRSKRQGKKATQKEKIYSRLAGVLEFSEKGCLKKGNKGYHIKGRAKQEAFKLHNGCYFLESESHTWKKKP